MRIATLAVVVVASSALAHAAAAATLSVGPGQTYAKPCDAIAAANAGDTIEVDAAGSYDGDTCAWSTDNLTIRGINGRAKIDDTGVTPTQQKGIFTINAPTATIESFELSGAAISADAGNNGAGIRHLGTNLTVRDCYFHDNQDGILGSPATAGTGTVVIEASEFANNGAGDGFSHNMYLGDYASFTLHASYSHGAKVGHLVKSRAYVTSILYNRLTDETGTTASYELDLPNGGTAYVIGNVIEQSAATGNPIIINSGEEGTTNPDQHVYLINNTIVNDATGGTFANLATGTTALLENNILVGPGTITALATATQIATWTDAQGDPLLVDRASYDYHLQAGSPCIDAGTQPGSASGGMSLAPVEDYVQPLATEPRSVVGGAIDLGAYEYGTQATPADDLPNDGNDNTAVTHSSGCGCDGRAPGARASWLLLTLVVAFALRRRR